MAYNKAHGITPVTVRKAITEGIEAIVKQRKAEEEATGITGEVLDKAETIRELETEMEALAEQLRFEEAAELRDKILELQGKKVERGIGGLRRKKRGPRSAPSKAMRGMEAPARYGRGPGRRWK